ncbi:methyltransferase domain-containing protein [Natronorubrum sp. JWXQ-INN-674]|uniref:Methyltransferase domain-containing protein n=1 Tax=Natronorubrum halalkaliphilum TaxID=2691917 RepID=A0A6B0VL31_9EURY|nr:class I SAM-dependent methyltransferase [Natronorubrum halalkaliphilum]MXV61817.1 methyltransferase domain-containing protein [Natronorubrum halalkaliphilum]
MGTIVSPVEELAQFAARNSEGDPPTVVVAGCGRGRTVDGLLEHGVDAYGFDISPDALADAETSPDRLEQCDLEDPELVDRLRTSFDVERIDVFYTEQVLSLLAPDVADRVTAQLRADDAVGRCVHRIAPMPPAAAQNGEFDATDRSVSEWKAQCDPDGEDVWLSVGEQFQKSD